MNATMRMRASELSMALGTEDPRQIVEAARCYIEEYYRERKWEVRQCSNPFDGPFCDVCESCGNYDCITERCTISGRTMTWI